MSAQALRSLAVRAAAVGASGLLCRGPPGERPKRQGQARWPVRCEQPPAGPKFDREWDCRHPADESVACQGRTKVVLLIRHGQYETKGGPGYGRLTEVGREQARMAGQHIVARMRADAGLKKAMFKLTSSALDRAVETGDIIQKEIVAELEWVDVKRKDLADDTLLRVTGALEGGFLELSVLSDASLALEDKENLLQPKVEVRQGSRLRIALKGPAPAAGAELPLSAVAEAGAAVAVYRALGPVRKLDERFEDWRCSGCKAADPRGDVHWSDDAETNGLGFCDACKAAGPSHKKLKPGDTCARSTQGVPRDPFRAPNDKNLNEADVDTCSVLMKGDSLYRHYGELNAQILKDNAVVNAAFYTHMHRVVDHKTIKRPKRADTLRLTFVSGKGEKHERHWTAEEFKKLDLGQAGECSWIWDDNVKERVDGPFTLQSVGDVSVAGKPAAEIGELVRKRGKEIARERPGRQVEILVIHGNVIRYMFLKAMQFDTTWWLNFGGSNCAMTQLRLTRKGDVICDFFGDHGSMTPVSHYTYNKSPDV